MHKNICNTKIMVKKLNKKKCSHDAYKQWNNVFYFIFLPLLFLVLYIFYVCGSLGIIEKL